MSMRQKAAIAEVGSAVPQEPDEFGRVWRIGYWAFEGGDFPGVDGATNCIGGWSPPELMLLEAVARRCGHDVALEVAEACRTAPPTSSSDGVLRLRTPEPLPNPPVQPGVPPVAYC